MSHAHLTPRVLRIALRRARSRDPVALEAKPTSPWIVAEGLIGGHELEWAQNRKNVAYLECKPTDATNKAIDLVIKALDIPGGEDIVNRLRPSERADS